MDLVIVESPTKARTLGKFLGSKYRIEATMGHIRDLPERKMGIVINGGVKMEYEVLPDKTERVRELGKAFIDADTVYLATDPDREGEAIAFHVAELMKGKRAKPQAKLKAKTAKVEEKKILRIVFHEITETAIKEALVHPREIDTQLVDAQQARRALDRLVGYKLSPLLWRKVRKGLSAGRVQSVALRLIVEREREIEKFIPEEYWVIQVLVSVSQGKFWVGLIGKDGKKLKITNGSEAGGAVSDLNSAAYSVVKVEKKEARRTPPPPFTTSTLQQMAANKLGWGAKRTMQIAQGLYEKGLITYHRTDSTNLAVEAVAAARNYIISKFGESYALVNPRFYKTKSKVAQEAHEAIRPTNVNQELGIGNSGESNREEERLYGLIWKRFVACQMAEMLLDQTIIDVDGRSGLDVYNLEARGEVIKFDGWNRVYGDSLGEQVKVRREEDEGDEVEKREEEQRLPEVNEGERLEKQEVKSEQKFTQPPARFNEAGLIKALEELGIGRPSTYAPIISTITERRYVEKEHRRLKPTVLGVAVNDFLVTNFADIMDYQFTAKMEDELDSIANGELEWQGVIKGFYGPFSEKLITVGQEAVRVSVETEGTGEVCPDCKEGEMVIRFGRYGKFLSCSRFPECKYKANYIQKIEGVKCPKDGGDILVRKTRRGKAFFGCSNWPKCDFASWTKPK